MAYLQFTTAVPEDELAAALRAAVTRIHHLSQRLFVLSRDGQAGLRRHLLDLRTVVEAEADHVQRQSAQLRVTVSAPAQPVPVAGDPTLLALAVTTALRNAAEAYDPRAALAPITVHIAVVGSDVQLVIADRGPGFAPQILGMIQTGHSLLGTTTKAHGSGTGLSLIVGVAQLHGGRATFGNQSGGGAAVTVTLPRAAAVTSAEAEQPWAAMVA